MNKTNRRIYHNKFFRKSGFLFILLFLFSLIYPGLLHSEDNLLYSAEENYKKPFIFPLEGNIITSFRQTYFDHTKNVYRKHTGIDIEGHAGQKIKASGNGVVCYKGFSPTGGRTVVIRHNQKIRTTYLNLSAIYVSTGDFIQQGDIIASIGASDDPSSDQPHLHFGVIYLESYLNPAQLLEIDYSSISRFLHLKYLPGDFFVTDSL